MRPLRPNHRQFLLQLFDKLRNERPSSFEKLVPVAGNVATEGLGLLPADRQILIDRVSVIFHVAADVRFDRSLKDAIFNNTRSVRDMCILASNMKNLAVSFLSSKSNLSQRRVTRIIVHIKELLNGKFEMKVLLYEADTGCRFYWHN